MSVISSDDIMNFIVTVTEGHKSSTKKLKYSLLKTFFNFIKNSIDQSISNPCESPILKKTFKAAVNLRLFFIPKKVADRLRTYIASENIKKEDRVFPLGYTRAREIVKNAGNEIGVFCKTA